MYTGRARWGRDHDLVLKLPNGAIMYDRFRNDPRDLAEVNESPFRTARGALEKRATALPTVYDVTIRIGPTG